MGDKKKRVVSFLGLVLLIGVVAFSSMGCYFCYKMGAYNKNRKKILSETQENLLKNYSMKIYKTHSNKNIWTEMEKSNMEYEVLLYSEGINSSSKILYKTRNFKEKNVKNIEKFVGYNYGKEVCMYNDSIIGSIFSGGSHWSVIDYVNNENIRVWTESKEIVYNESDDIFYYVTAKYSFPVKNIAVKEKEVLENLYSYKNLKAQNDKWYSYQLRKKLGKEYHYNLEDSDNTSLRIRDENKYFSGKNYKDYECFNMDGYIVDSKDLRTVTSEDIPSQYNNTKLKNEFNTYDVDRENDKTNIYYYVNDINDTEIIQIKSYVKNDLSDKYNDLFFSQKKVVYINCFLKYIYIIGAVAGGIAAAYFFGKSCWQIFCIGRQVQGKSNIILHSVPLIFYLLTIAGLMLTTILKCNIISNLILNETSLYFVNLKIMILLMIIMLFGAMIALFIQEISYRIGNKTLLKSFILYIIFNGTVGKISLKKKAFIMFCLVSSVQIIIMFYIKKLHVETGIIIWGVYRFIVAVIIIYFVVQVNKLLKKGKDMFDGDLETHIDTSKMICELKKHGEHLNGISEGMNIALKERMRSEHFKTELITNVSHDIKTPLTSIINYVDLINREDIKDERVREYLNVVDRQSAKMKKLIEDLMEASKAATGNLNVEMESCNVDILLTQIIGEFQERFEHRNLEFIVQKPEKELLITADNRHLWRIFQNIIINACKYSQEGTRVYVNLKNENSKVYISVLNVSREPLNISPDELRERFVRGDSSRNTEGSGLGLSIANDLCKLMNGDMKISIEGDLFKIQIIFDERVEKDEIQ